MKPADVLSRLSIWSRAGSRWWVAVAGGVLLLLLLGAGGWYWWSASQMAGLSAYSRAGMLAQDALSTANPEQLRSAIAALEDFIRRYPRHRAVPEAAYHLGNLRYQARAYDAARGAYQLALRMGAKESLATLCRLGIGYAWEAQNNYQNALVAYQEAAARIEKKDFLYEEALLAVGRAQELLQQRAQAISTYRGILRDRPLSGRAEEIRARLASLEGAPRP